MLFTSITASAYDFQVDGIYYNITSSKNKTVKVSYKNTNYNSYSSEVVIPSEVTYNGEKYTVISIGESAFEGCSGLTSVTIPNSVTNIEKYAFYGCSGLTEVNISSIESWCKIDFAEYSSNPLCYANKLNGEEIKDLIIPNTVTEIKPYAFYGCSGLTSVTIGNSVTSIGGSAFYGCSGLTSVTIGNSVTSIGGSAFEGCSGLTFVTIPNSVESLGNYTFYNCSNLISVTIGNSVKSINSRTFEGCGNIIKTIWLTNTPPSGYKNIKSKVNYVSNDQYSLLSNVKVYPYLSSMFEVDGIKYVPVSPSERTCDAIDCSSDTIAVNININNIVSFKGIDMTVKDIMPYCCYFNNNIKSVKINFNGNIPEHAFYGCKNLSEIRMLSNVKSIGDYAFDDCNSLKIVSIEDRETELTLGSNGSNPLFYDCPLDSVYIGGNISYPTSSSKGYSPFYRNKSLRSVVITDKETEIPENEFYGCTNLKTISMGDGMENIGNWAFSGCSSLEYFAFGSGMKSIGNEAFSDCTAMKKLTSKTTTPPSCGTQALDDINKWTCELYVPQSAVTAYQGADQWKEFFFINGLETTSIDSALADGSVIVTVENGNIMINGVEDAVVEVYSLNGQCIYSGTATSVPVTAKGMYIVRVNGKTQKVIVK